MIIELANSISINDVNNFFKGLGSDAFVWALIGAIVAIVGASLNNSRYYYDKFKAQDEQTEWVPRLIKVATAENITMGEVHQIASAVKPIYKNERYCDAILREVLEWDKKGIIQRIKDTWKNAGNDKEPMLQMDAIGRIIHWIVYGCKKVLLILIWGLIWWLAFKYIESYLSWIILAVLIISFFHYFLNLLYDFLVYKHNKTNIKLWKLFNVVVAQIIYSENKADPDKIRNIANVLLKNHWEYVEAKRSRLWQRKKAEIYRYLKMNEELEKSINFLNPDWRKITQGEDNTEKQEETNS